ncbi:suppressor of cytokine signaling 5-like [Babylonia areolata]|uniref:suppressor of cytokine signaling 5-like n=1 Tax=Babylonia areolata TaxID=304850 RepID=UPI003FD11413
MKKISLKDIILPTSRRSRGETSKSSNLSSRETEIESIADHPKMPNDSTVQVVSRSNHTDENAFETASPKRRDRTGLLRNLRRKFTPSFRRKTDSSEDCHFEDASQSQIISRAETRKSKQRSRYLSSLCDKPDRQANPVSSSSDNLSSFLQPYASSKLSESDWHGDSDCCDYEGGKQKGICWTKDSAKFSHDMYVVGGETSLHTCGGCDSQTCKRRNKKENSFTHTQIPGTCESDLDKDSEHEAPRMWSLTHELLRLSKFGWYWGPITRNEAEEKLAHQSDGAFLVRDSSDERYLLSLSFRSYGRTLHTRIEHCNGMFSFYAQPDTEGYPTIVDLIEHSMNDSQTGIFCYSRSRSPGAPSFPVRLTKPVSRFTQVRSLQYLCRFVIRQYTRYDHIQQLPLPTTLKGWIEENQY